MIIFLDLTNQIWEEVDISGGISFTWYNTVTDSILSWEDFKEDFNFSKMRCGSPLERFEKLFPLDKKSIN